MHGIIKIGMMIFVLFLSLSTMATQGNAAVVYNFSVTNGEATFTLDTNSIEIILRDTAVNPGSVAENLTGITFGATGGTPITSEIISPTSAGYVNVDKDGNPSAGVGPAEWAYFGDSSMYILAWNGNVIDPAIGGTTGPAFSIIGAPDGSGVYTDAGGSIAGNNPHNPFIYQTATFHLDIPGISAGTVLSDVTFKFNTDWNVEPPTPPVPEPGTLMLLGSGLIGLAGWGRKKFRK